RVGDDQRPASARKSGEPGGNGRRRQEQLAVVGRGLRRKPAIGDDRGGDRRREQRHDEAQLHARTHGTRRRVSAIHSTKAVTASALHVSMYSRCLSTPVSGLSCTAVRFGTGAPARTTIGSTAMPVARR